MESTQGREQPPSCDDVLDSLPETRRETNNSAGKWNASQKDQAGMLASPEGVKVYLHDIRAAV
jgi:hypothetical protein